MNMYNAIHSITHGTILNQVMKDYAPLPHTIRVNYPVSFRE